MNTNLTVNALMEHIRSERGSFFLARIGLRINFSLSKEGESRRQDHIQAIITACRELGFDPQPMLDSRVS